MIPAAATLIGTGALASFVGARLARAGVGITLLGTWREALETIAAHGLTVEDHSGRWCVVAQARRPGAATAPVGLTVVLVKSHQTASVAPTAAAATSREGVILTLQNGLGNAERLAAAAGPERVATGVAFLGATSLTAGVVRDGGGTRLVLEKHPRTAAAAEAFLAAGFDVEISADIASVQWLKLAANCAINPLSALSGLRNGALLEDEDLRTRLRAAAAEVGCVAEALGVHLARDPVQATLEIARVTAANDSSMLSDVRRGVATEIEELSGAVVRLADQHGVAVPVNRRLLEDVRALTTGRKPC